MAGDFGEKAWRMIEAPPRRINFAHGAVRSSKTTAQLFKWPEVVLGAPKNGDIVITGRTERTAYRNIVKALQKMYGKSRVRYNRGESEGRMAGRDFYVVGANDERAAEKIQGLTIAAWLGDETALYPESFTTMALSRMSPEGACAYWACNPGGPYHYLKQNYIDRADELDANIWHFLLEDNPNLSQSFIEGLKQEFGPTPLFYKRFIEGLWVAAEGAVFDFFDESKHRLEADPDQAPDYIDLSCDYGTSNATAVGAFGSYRGGGLKAYLMRLYYHSGRDTGRTKTDGEYADAIDDYFKDIKPKCRYFIVDPSAASFKAELSRRGWKVIDADNDVLNGIRTHSRMLKSGQFKLGSDDSVLPAVREYGGYLWDSKAQARGEDKPIKENDHCFAAGTLVETKRGAIPIEEVTTDDYVLTRIGYRRVLKSGLTQRNVPVMRCDFSNGAYLIGTANHPVFVQGEGFLRMDTLRYNYDIITVWHAKNQLPTMAESTEDIRIQKTNPTQSISGPRVALATYIDTFGKMRLATYPMGITFTTKMVTQPITALITLSAYLHTSICPTTTWAAPSPRNTMPKWLRRLRDGTSQKRAASGIAKCLKRPGRKCRTIKGFASVAARNTRLETKAACPDFAQTPVGLNSEEDRASITRLETAKFAALNSQPTSTARLGTARVVAPPKLVGKSDVYNLTVDGLPEFFANGVLVHNCMDAIRYYLQTLHAEGVRSSVADLRKAQGFK